MSMGAKLLKILVVIFCLICIGVAGWDIAIWVRAIKDGDLVNTIMYAVTIFMILLCSICGIVVSCFNIRVLLKSFGAAMIMIALFTLASVIYTSVLLSQCDKPDPPKACQTSTGDRVGLFYVPTIILIIAGFVAGVLGCILFTKMETDDKPEGNYY